MLEFLVPTMQLEMRHISDAASKFLQNAGPLNAVISELTAAADSGRVGTFPWQIPDTDGRRLRTNAGSEYEADGHCEHRVFGELAFIWDLQLINPRVKKRQRQFRIVGNASIKLRIVREADDHLLAQWQVEIAGHDAPGCFFHSAAGQVDDPAHEAWEFFPRSLPVPRLPTILVTPADALDFLLGELFQTEWRKRQGEDDDSVRGWSGCQRTRLHALLNWKASVINRAQGSAWNALKHAKPPPSIFL